MMCAVSHLCIADEQLIDLNGEQVTQIRPARPTPPRPTPPPTLDPKLWAGTGTLQLKDFRAEPESVMYQNKLEEGVTCRGGIPKACYSKGSVEPTGQDVCKRTEGKKLKVKKVAVYAVDPKANNCRGLLPAGFGKAKLELRNVQCECPTLTGCYNTEQVKNEQTGRKDDKRVMVKMDSKSTATIGGNSLDTDFKFDCYVAALQQVMDRAELRASAKEQEKAFSGKGSAAGKEEEVGEDDEDDELAGLGGGGFVALPTVKIETVKPRRGGGELGEEQTAGRRGGSFSPQQKFSLSFANRAGALV